MSVLKSLTGVTGDEFPLGACVSDPERWMSAPDAEAKALCRSCPRRWLCAKEAAETPGAVGLWAGIEIPESGRARAFALAQLRSMAERHGYRVREPRAEAVSA